MAASCQGVESTQKEQVLGVGAVVRVRGEALSGFDDDGGREVEVVVSGDGVAVLGDRGDLGEGVEGAATMELSVDDREGLNACAELRGRLAHSLGPVSYTHLDVYKRQIQPPTQTSHVIQPGQFSTPPTNVAIPTTTF